MQFHERLYEVRKRSGMTQNDLAEKLEVSRQAVSRWEMGTAKPEFENLIAISDLLNVSTDYLLKGKEHSAEEPQITEDVPEESAEKMGFWEKLYLIAIVMFGTFTLIFGLAAQDIATGIVSAITIMIVIVLVISVVCLAVWIVRELLKRIK